MFCDFIKVEYDFFFILNLYCASYWIIRMLVNVAEYLIMNNESFFIEYG